MTHKGFCPRCNSGPLVRPGPNDLCCPDEFCDWEMYYPANGRSEDELRAIIRETVFVDTTKCPKCGYTKIKGCYGDGWMEPLGPYRDGSYITSYPCRNDNPYYE